jgi:CDP-diacylglycerol pyrophosphatase
MIKPRSLLAYAVPVLLGLAVLLGVVIAGSAGAARSGKLSELFKAAETAHPDALWHVVHDLCVTDMKTRGSPTPCTKVSLEGGWAVVRDPEHPTQYLLAPTARVAGIESPALQAKGSPNYWQAAWSARGLLERAAGQHVPRQAVGLAVNSVGSRTQNQLHIHIDCVRPDVAAALQAHAPKLGRHWSILRGPLFEDRWRARWIPGFDLGTSDPFKLLAQADPAARADMGDFGLFLMGAVRDGRPGFILVSRHDTPPGNVVAAEYLLDHSCRMLDQRS